MIAWELPDIPADGVGFSFVRAVPDSGAAQVYEPVYAPGGSDSVRKVLTTAGNLGTVAPLDSSSALYALVEVVDEHGSPVGNLTFNVPTHQAFLWWATNMELRPDVSDWMDMAITWPEDPRVELLLTTATARLLGGLLDYALLITGERITSESRATVLQVMDALRRQTGYADRDRQHLTEPRMEQHEQQRPA